jgi:DEAD/DEAH box helicase domain-containing protein
LCRHPRYLFGRSPENALINPQNLRILASHLQCAAFELPFKEGDRYGGMPVGGLLDALADAGMLHRTRTQYHYLGEEIPAHVVSLRTSGQDRVVIHDTSQAQPEVIGEVDLESVPFMAYEGAIYMHQARTFEVMHLDWEARLAEVQPVDVDYYTRASMSTRIARLDAEEGTEAGGILHAYGETTVVSQATGFRKIRRYTHETLGYGPIDLPEMSLETMGYWLVIGEKVTEELVKAGVLLTPNDYGPDWDRQRKRALERDGYQCRTCGAVSRQGQGLHVHHVRPFREYLWAWLASQGRAHVPSGELPASFYERANHLDNLATLCPSCHRRAEEGQQTRSALGGLGYTLRNLAPLFLMCDPGDIDVSAEIRNPLTRAPTVLIYEQVPAGVGFSQRLYENCQELLAAALELVTDCTCRDGCPACVGPPGDIGPDTKAATLKLLRKLVGSKENVAQSNGVNR